MLGAIVLCFLALEVDDGAEVTADQFARLVTTRRAEYRDVSFLFEGQLQVVPRGVSVDDVISGRIPDKKGATYQGKYVLRADGATYLDIMTTTNFDLLPSTTAKWLTLVGNKLTTVERSSAGETITTWKRPVGLAV